MADKRPTELTTEETTLRGFVHSDDATNGSRKFNLARVLERLIERSPRPRRISDAATSHRAERVQYGTVGALAGAPYATLEADNYLVPASAPSSNIVLAAYTTSATSAPSGQAHSLVWFVEATTGYLVLLETGATPATDYRRYASNASICTGTAYRARLTAGITGGSSTPPVMSLNGSTVAATETTGAGTDPDWLHPSLVNTWTLYNYNAPAGDVADVRIYNGLYSEAEQNTFTAGGARPTWAEAPGTQSATGRTAQNGGTGGARAMTTFSGATATGFTGGGNNGGATYAGIVIQNVAPGQIVTLTYTYDPNTVAAPPTLRFIKGPDFVSSETNVSHTVLSGSTSAPSGGAGTYSISLLITGPSEGGLYLGWRHGPLTTGTFIISAASVQVTGAFDIPLTQPGLTTGDALARFSRRLVGISSHPLTHRGTLYLNTSTASNEQALGGALFDSTDYVLDGPYEQLTKTGTPTTSVGHTSGGTQYKASAALTAGINVGTVATRKLGGTSVYVASNDTTKVRTVLPFRKLATPAD